METGAGGYNQGGGGGGRGGYSSAGGGGGRGRGGGRGYHQQQQQHQGGIQITLPDNRGGGGRGGGRGGGIIAGGTPMKQLCRNFNLQSMSCPSLEQFGSCKFYHPTNPAEYNKLAASQKQGGSMEGKVLLQKKPPREKISADVVPVFYRSGPGLGPTTGCYKEHHLKNGMKRADVCELAAVNETLKHELKMGDLQIMELEEIVFNIAHVAPKINGGKHGIISLVGKEAEEGKFALPPQMRNEKSEAYFPDADQYGTNGDFSLLVPMNILTQIDKIFDMLDDNHDGKLTKDDFINDLDLDPVPSRNDTLGAKGGAEKQHFSKRDSWELLERSICKVKGNHMMGRGQVLTEQQVLATREITRNDFKIYFINNAMQAPIKYEGDLLVQPDSTFGSVLLSARSKLQQHLVILINRFVREHNLQPDLEINP